MVEHTPHTNTSDAQVTGISAKPWGWAGTMADLRREPARNWLAALERYTTGLNGVPPSEGQIGAWRDEWLVIQVALAWLQPGTNSDVWTIVFEYELPFEGGRRPDAVLLAGETVVVLEFKQSAQVTVAHFDQVQAYSRDLAEYHGASHYRRVEAVLVATNETDVDMRRGQVFLAGRESLGPLLARLASAGQIDAQTWLEAPYAPLPALVAAARRIFQHERLPHVRQALDERIPERIAAVQSLIAEAQATGRRRLILVTGAPGAGKTLVGLRIVYEHGEGAPEAAMLSGDGPLVKVL